MRFGSLMVLNKYINYVGAKNGSDLAMESSLLTLAGSNCVATDEAILLGKAPVTWLLYCGSDIR